MVESSVLLNEDLLAIGRMPKMDFVTNAEPPCLLRHRVRTIILPIAKRICECRSREVGGLTSVRECRASGSLISSMRVSMSQRAAALCADDVFISIFANLYADLD